MTICSHTRIRRAKMSAVRTFLLRSRVMAFAVIALALALKTIVPAGYMVGSESKVLSIRICDETQLSAALHARDIAIPMKGEPAGKPSKVESMCPYGALSFASLSGADPVQLALALLFILAAGFAALARPARSRLTQSRSSPCRTCGLPS
jgi:hypothetical protein